MESLVMLMKPQKFRCQMKGNSEQLLQDFLSYKKKMERFFKGSKAVREHMGEQEEATHVNHAVCSS